MIAGFMNDARDGHKDTAKMIGRRQTETAACILLDMHENGSRGEPFGGPFSRLGKVKVFEEEVTLS